MDAWNHPLNKQASKALKRAGLEPNRKSLPILDLMLWRLDKGDLAVDTSVEDTARAMFRWKPEAAMNYLLGDLPEEEERISPLENLTEPEQLAEELLALLEVTESEKNPHYMGAAR